MVSWKLTPGAMLGVRTEQLQEDVSWALQAAKGGSIQMDINRQDSCQIASQVAFATTTAPPPSVWSRHCTGPLKMQNRHRRGFIGKCMEQLRN